MFTCKAQALNIRGTGLNSMLFQFSALVYMDVSMTYIQLPPRGHQPFVHRRGSFPAFSIGSTFNIVINVANTDTIQPRITLTDIGMHNNLSLLLSCAKLRRTKWGCGTTFVISAGGKKSSMDRTDRSYGDSYKLQRRTILSPWDSCDERGWMRCYILQKHGV